MRATPLLIGVPAILLALSLTGCERGDPTVRSWGRDPVQPTAEEQALLEQIARDAFVKLNGLERDSENRLIVTTQQGDVVVRYLLAPVADGGQDLVIRRIEERLELVTAVDADKGTGPEARGVRR